MGKQILSRGKSCLFGRKKERFLYKKSEGEKNIPFRGMSENEHTIGLHRNLYKTRQLQTQREHQSVTHAGVRKHICAYTLFRGRQLVLARNCPDLETSVK